MNILPSASYGIAVPNTAKTGSNIEMATQAQAETELPPAAPKNTSNVIISAASAPTTPNEVYSEPKFVTQNVLTHSEQDDALSKLLLNKLHQRDMAFSAMVDVGSILKEAVQGESTKFTQSARSYSHFEMYANQAAIDFNAIEFTNIQELGSFSFTLITQDGDELTLQVKIQQGQSGGVSFQGLMVEYELDGELSEEEQEQLEIFASKLNQFSQAYQQKGKVALQSLPIYELSEFAQVDLEFIDTLSNRSLKVSYSEDDIGRTLDVENRYTSEAENGEQVITTDKVNLSFDKFDLSSQTNEGKKQQALNQYLSILRESIKQGQGSDNMKWLMTDSLSVLHRSEIIDELETQAELDQELEEENENEGSVKSDNTQSIFTVATRSLMPELSNRDQSLLTGLNDFTMSAYTKEIYLEDYMSLGNREKPHEKAKFNLELSQDTKFEEDNGGNLREIQQTQKFDFSAAYHKALYPLELVDFDNQSYRYYQVEEKQEKTSTQRFDEKGQLILATLFTKVESERHMSEYRLGELTDEDHDQKSTAQIEDYTDALLAVEEQDELNLLEEVLIEPFEKEESVFVKALKEERDK